MIQICTGCGSASENGEGAQAHAMDSVGARHASPEIHIWETGEAPSATSPEDKCLAPTPNL